MPSRCSFGCTYDHTTTMHRFPNPDKFPERFATWVRLVGGKLEMASDYTQYRNKFICNIHFAIHHRNRFKRLNALAVPTLHLHGASKHDLKDTQTLNEPTNLVHVENIPSTTQATISGVSKINLEEVQSVEPTNIIPFENIPSSSQAISSGEDAAVLPVNDHFQTDNPVDDDQLSTEVTDLAEPAIAQFSWQETSCIALKDEPCTVSNDVHFTEAQSEAVGDISDSAVAKDYVRNDVRKMKTDHCCDACRLYITGYTCVQCEDYDLCGTCEATLIHPQHYMLRVPGPRPQREVKLIIDAIRRKLEILEAELHNDGIARMDWDVEIKKEEDPFEELATESIQHDMEDTIHKVATVNHWKVKNVPDISNQLRTVDEEQAKGKINHTYTPELEHSEVFENVPNEATEPIEDVCDSKSVDWLDESLLEVVDYVDSCNANKKHSLQDLVNDLQLKNNVRSDGTGGNNNIVVKPSLDSTYAVPKIKNNTLQLKDLKHSPDLDILNSKKSDTTFKASKSHKSKTIRLSVVPINRKAKNMHYKHINIGSSRPSVRKKDIPIHETKIKTNAADNIVDDLTQLSTSSEIIPVSETMGKTANDTGINVTNKDKMDSRKILIVQLEDISKLITRHQLIS